MAVNVKSLSGFEKASTFAKQICLGHLSCKEAQTAYQSTICIPSVSYSLTSFTPIEAGSIQKAALQAFLTAMGINGNVKQATVFGPTHYGGLNLKCPYTLEFLWETSVLTAPSANSLSQPSACTNCPQESANPAAKIEYSV
jgi:hypothetical protein